MSGGGGVRVEPEPEWDGPDPLMEMVKHMHRMVPESRVAEARSAALRELREEVAGMFGEFHPMCAIEDEPTDHKVVSRKAVLTAIDRRLGE